MRTLSSLALISLFLSGCGREAATLGPHAGGGTALTAQAVTKTYTASTADFPNPERGFYIQIQQFFKGGAKPAAISLQRLQSARAANQSMVRIYYVLPDYRTRALDQAVLDRVQGDLNTVRQAGVKAIVRFTYNFGEQYGATGKWYADQDASKDQIVAHLDQLKGVIQGNSDVIAFMEAGFVGVWGEWHHTTNNNEVEQNGQPTYQANDNTRAIMDKILAVLPSNRMVALRYPRYKFSLYGTTPLDYSTAYSTQPRARVGGHNDCFLASPNDFATYGDVEAEKNFYNQDNRFLPMGGETCYSGPEAQPYIPCPNAVADLTRLRFDTLNVEYEPNVIQRWRNEGCFDQIARQLGYRFRLLQSVTPDSVRPGNTFSMSYQLRNDGWGKMYNRHHIDVVLRNTSSGQRYRLTWYGEDHRYLPSGSTHYVTINAGLPSDMPVGTYDVLLSFPDPDSRLYNRPEYSIRLANDNVWESSTGYNNLGQRVSVSTSATGTAYTGTSWFTRL